MINFFKKLFGKTEQPVAAEAPYKVETPVVDTADIALAQKPAGGAAIVEQASEAVITSIAKEPKKKAGKKPAGPKKQGSARPRKPRAPKQPKA